MMTSFMVFLSHDAGKSRLEISCEQLIDIGVGRQSRETGKAAVRFQPLRRANEACPGGEGQCSADADAPHTERRDVGNVEPDVSDDEEIERLWPNRFYQRSDVLRLVWTWREQHIRARLRVRL